MDVQYVTPPTAAADVITRPPYSGIPKHIYQRLTRPCSGCRHRGIDPDYDSERDREIGSAIADFLVAAGEFAPVARLGVPFRQMVDTLAEVARIEVSEDEISPDREVSDVICCMRAAGRRLRLVLYRQASAGAWERSMVNWLSSWLMLHDGVSMPDGRVIYSVKIDHRICWAVL